MIYIQRYSKNPLLRPDSNNAWEAAAAFNGCVIKDNDSYHLFYRALSKQQEYCGRFMQLSTIGHAISTDGLDFVNREQYLKPEYDWELFGCEDPRITKVDNEYFLFYTALSDFPPSPAGIKIGVALTDNLKYIKEKHPVTPFNSKAMSLFSEKINNQYVAILTVNTDIPPSKICIAKFDKKEDIWSDEYWHQWYQHLDDHALPLQRLNTAQIEVGAPPVKTEYGWLVIYAYIRNYFIPGHSEFSVEAVLLDANDPQKIKGRVHGTLLKPVEEYELKGMVSNVVFPSGALIKDDKFYIYYGASDTTICAAYCDLRDLLEAVQVNAAAAPKVKKYSGNPILIPEPEHNWEGQAVLNPAAVYENGRIHMVYRAFANDNTSYFGYASSADGFNFDERLADPIYIPRKSFEDKKIPNGNSGCEDPRITKINDRYYVCYTAFNGVSTPRVALSSISVDDFLHHRWNWTEPVLISPPGVDDKDSCILPEKVNGKYMFFHRIENDIVTDFVDSLNFDGEHWLRSLSYIPLRDDLWDNTKVGISAPPIKSEYGWVLLYHGISQLDHQYRVGAMLLSLDDPSEVVARSHTPILEPELPFEKKGLVDNVVFPCGAVLKDKDLFIYYGGADKVICVATINFQTLVNYLSECRYKKYLI